MNAPDAAAGRPNRHVFLGRDHDHNERRTWWVIALCGVMMIGEIVAGLLFGSIALVADGLHMSTHAGALLLAALAYRFAREYAEDARFAWSTGKLGDLAGFTSAIVLALIALLIAYASVARLFAPVPIDFSEAIPIAVLGLAVNVASVLLLRGGHHHHGHGHAHTQTPAIPIDTPTGPATLRLAEENGPPRFELRAAELAALAAATIETERADGGRQRFALRGGDGCLESIDTVPEPHAFTATVCLGAARGAPAVFREEVADHDNNMRAAVLHVVADAAVSTFVIVGLLLGRFFGLTWMDPVAALAGAAVIASWSYALIRDTGAVLLDINPDLRMTDDIRAAIERDGDRLSCVHVWRLGPGHLGASVSVVTATARGSAFYRAQLAHVAALSHLTVEVLPACDGHA